MVQVQTNDAVIPPIHHISMMVLSVLFSFVATFLLSSLPPGKSLSSILRSKELETLLKGPQTEMIYGKETFEKLFI